jgi:hypothetical protein
MLIVEAGVHVAQGAVISLMFSPTIEAPLVRLVVDLIGLTVEATVFFVVPVVLVPAAPFLGESAAGRSAYREDRAS